MELERWHEGDGEKDIDDFIFEGVEWHESER